MLYQSDAGQHQGLKCDLGWCVAVACSPRLGEERGMWMLLSHVLYAIEGSIFFFRKAAGRETVKVCRYVEMKEEIKSFMDWLVGRVRWNEQWIKLLNRCRPEDFE